MSIGKRIKELRKDILKLNQTDFGAPLGLTYSAIGGYEKEIRNVSDQSILAICREYGVSEQWLRTGEGDIFSSNQVPSTIVSNLAQEYDLDLMDQNLIAEYLKLDKQSREVLKGYIRRVFLASDEEAAIREEVASYEAELRAEKGEKSSASGTTNAKEA